MKNENLTSAMLKDLAESATYSLQETLTSGEADTIDSVVSDIFDEWVPVEKSDAKKFFEAIDDSKRLVSIWNAVPGGRQYLIKAKNEIRTSIGEEIINRVMASIDKPIKDSSSTAYEVELHMEDEAELGDMVVVNIGTAPSPKFKIGKILRRDGKGKDFKVLVSLAGGRKNTYRFVEAPIGLVAFSDLIVRKIPAETYDELDSIVDQDRWISFGAVDWYANSLTSTQKKIHDNISKNGSSRGTEENIPGEGIVLDLFNDSKKLDLLFNLDNKRLSIIQKELVSALNEMTGVEVVHDELSPIYINQELDEDTFFLKIKTLVNDYTVMTQDDEKWDLVSTKNPHDAEVDEKDMNTLLMNIAKLGAEI